MFKPLTLPAKSAMATALLAMLVLPLITGNPYVIHVLILAMIYGVFASAWNFVTGYAGLKTFGHHAFFGIGAYSSALISSNFGLSPWLTLWIGGFIAVGAGLAIGTPVLRIRSLPHVAIVTLGFAEIIRLCVANLSDITRGELGLWGISHFSEFSLPWVGRVTFTPADKVSFYYLALALMVFNLIVIVSIMRSKIGLSILAMRDGEDAAQSLGVNLARIKLMVFAVSAFLVGTIGAFYAHYMLILTPSSVLGMEMMILTIAMVLVGGLGTFTGPILGALLLTLLMEALRDVQQFRLLSFGLLTVAIVMFLPKGVVELPKLFYRRSGSS